MVTHETDSEVLSGVAAIAAFMGMKTRQAQYHIDCGRLPVFRVGRTICARKPTLRRWMAEQEAASTQEIRAIADQAIEAAATRRTA